MFCSIPSQVLPTAAPPICECGVKLERTHEATTGCRAQLKQSEALSSVNIN